MRWERDSGGGLVVTSWTPDTIEARNEHLAWLMRNRHPWRLVNGALLHGRREQIADDLRELMQIGRSKWKSGLRDLALAGEIVGAEGTYGALGAYPLSGELTSVTPTATETGLVSAANASLFMPIPANGVLAPQTYRFVIGARVNTTATAANYTWTPRLGNANTSPSFGASAALAKTISITNAYLIWKGDFTIQVVGPPGNNSKAWGHFEVKLNTASGGAFTGWMWGSSAQASFDTSVAPGASVNGGQLWLGATASAAAADPFLVSQVHFMDWN